jgi:transcriptional regulator with GAF, ATPase, and Fis domain
MQARIIAATNRNLTALVQAGKFREDLYFRLNVFELWMPPLRERRGDITILANHFLNYFAGHYKKAIHGFAPEALEFLQNCDFPGNVRELRNMVERAVMRADLPIINFSHLVSLKPPAFASPSEFKPAPELEPEAMPSQPSIPTGGPAMNLADLEESKILEALDLADGNKTRAAQMLGISRTALHRRLQKYEARKG